MISAHSHLNAAGALRRMATNERNPERKRRLISLARWRLWEAQRTETITVERGGFDLRRQQAAE